MNEYCTMCLWRWCREDHGYGLATVHYTPQGTPYGDNEWRLERAFLVNQHSLSPCTPRTTHVHINSPLTQRSTLWCDHIEWNNEWIHTLRHTVSESTHTHWA